MVCVSELCDTVVHVIMYLLSESEQHVRASLRDAILLLCQTGLKYNTELSVDGLLAVTLDKERVFLLSIKETLQANEPCSTNGDSGCLCSADNDAVLNFSSRCLSAVTSAGSDDQSLSNGSESECTQNDTSFRLPTEMPTRCAEDATQLDDESLNKSDCLSRRRQRKQRRTVRRFVDTSCSTASPSVSSQAERILGWPGSESNDTPVCNASEDGHCNSACKSPELLSDVSELQTSAPAAVASADSDHQALLNCCDQDFNAVSSLRSPPEDQKQCESETLIDSTLPNKESLPVFDHVSKQNHRKRRRTVQRYLHSSNCPITSSSAMSLESSHAEHIPRWANNENGEAAITNEVENSRCKMEVLDNQPDVTQTERTDLSASFHLSGNVKAEVIEPALAGTDIASQLASLDHTIQPSSDPQQEMALPQFGLSAIVASMQSHFALMPKPFPWSIRTFPSLSPPSLPAAQCGMVGISQLY